MRPFFILLYYNNELLMLLLRLLLKNYFIKVNQSLTLNDLQMENLKKFRVLFCILLSVLMLHLSSCNEEDPEPVYPEIPTGLDEDRSNGDEYWKERDQQAFLLDNIFKA
jgi:hypothetical protein